MNEKIKIISEAILNEQLTAERILQLDTKFVYN